MWRDLRHKYVLPIFGVYYEESILYMVMPWMSFGTIMDYIGSYAETVDTVDVRPTIDVRPYVSPPNFVNIRLRTNFVGLGTRDCRRN
jgi:serine/threonine protein kinase